MNEQTLKYHICCVRLIEDALEGDLGSAMTDVGGGCTSSLFETFARRIRLIRRRAVQSTSEACDRNRISSALRLLSGNLSYDNVARAKKILEGILEYDKKCSACGCACDDCECRMGCCTKCGCYNTKL